MKQFVIAAVLLSLLVGCKQHSGAESTGNSMEYASEHIRIDDTVIDKGSSSDVIDPVWWTANIYDDEAAYNKSLAPFTREQRLVFAIAWYEAEVNNGGHDQFYFNSTGIVWKDALEGLREIGLSEAAAILEESAKRIGGNPSLDRSARQEQLDKYKPEFDDLDAGFYKLNLETAIHNYIVKHRTAFYFEGDVKKPKPGNSSKSS